MPIAMTQGSDKYYLHYDQVGSLRAITDTSHNIIKEITYDTYGNILTDTNPSFKVPFGFAGGLYDIDTKLTRFGYRDYDAFTGKWTAKDPIGFRGGDSNLYGYVWEDPVNWSDSNGLRGARGFTGGGFGGFKPITYPWSNGSGWTWADEFLHDLDNWWDDVCYASKGGKQNKGDTGLRDYTDEEIEELYKNAKGKDKKRYEKELKHRKKKNQQKRKSRGY